MPCRSDYLEPTHAEQNSREAAQHLVYAYTKLKKDVPEEIAKAAREIYGNPAQLDTMVIELCSTITNMTKKQRETIVYDAHDKQARSLAEWWEEHQEADKKRLEHEDLINKDLKLVAKAAAKLSEAEIEALKRTFKRNS